MQLESLRVELRPRSSWEAVELGTALVRANARAIWLPWLLVVLPVFAIVNAAAALIDAVWLAWLLMWWLKPLFDRIPLFVLSRSVFGDTPSLRQTLAAQRSWGWRAMRSALTWRRLGMARALTLPIDLLEGVSADRLSARRRVLSQTVSGNAALLTLVCVMFIVALSLSLLGIALFLVPSELLMSESMRALWALARSSPPPWAQVLVHAAVWVGTSIVEPFYIGAGFGLYLNRRTRIEAWDIEIAFRRMRRRLTAGVVPMLAAACVMLGLSTAVSPGHAATLPQTSDAGVAAAAVQDVAADETAADVDDADNGSSVDSTTRDPRMASADPPAADTTADDRAAGDETHGADGDEDSDSKDAPPVDHDAPVALSTVFGDSPRGAAGFDQAVRRAYEDPLLAPKGTRGYWKRRHPPKDDDNSKVDVEGLEAMISSISRVFGAIAEGGLWLLLAVLVILLLITARRWWPWLAGRTPKAEPPSAVDVSDAQLPDVLPKDIASAARALWREGRPRRALALLYRASVGTMSGRADVQLPPGATESECLRASRRMPEADDRDAFAQVVRTWQYAAYAQRLPDDDGFESLLAVASRRFGWAA